MNCQRIDPEKEKTPLFSDAVAAFDGDSVALRFVLASDTHVMPLPAWMDSRGRFLDMIDLAYAYADACPKPGLDAFLVVGDLVDNGRPSEYEEFLSLVKEKARPETPWITVMGNHEYMEGSEEEYRRYICPETAVHAVIKGYHFIGASCEDGHGCLRGHLPFLHQAVEEALAANPEKPVFTFQHYPIANTVHLSHYHREGSEWTESSEELREICSKSSRIVNFSGHSHGPVNHPRAIWQKDFTAFANGTLTYFCHGRRLTVDYFDPWMIEEANQFCIVEVLADHTVRIIPLDVHTKDVFRVPINGGPLRFEFNVSHPESWPYTEEKRAQVPPPRFGEDATVTVNRENGNAVSLTFPQAMADGCIERYHVTVKGDDGSEYPFDYSSAYFLKPMPESITVTLSEALTKGVTYGVTVEPFDALGKQGAPLMTVFSA
jgi:predicted MPP superfamily phosphohydrolase